MDDAFRKVAHRVSTLAGTPLAFLLAFAIVLVWAVSGPLFGFSDTWQLVINTGTTIVTFLMVFLIQNTQNRDSRALHMKLDELIIFTKGAENEFVELENLSDEQLDALEAQFHRLAKTLGREDVLAGEKISAPSLREAVDAGTAESTRPNGKIAAKFDGPTGTDELREPLTKVTS
jgi:low affinity Fe/Cu permease